MFNSFLKWVCVYRGCNCLRPQQELRSQVTSRLNFPFLRSFLKAVLGVGLWPFRLRSLLYWTLSYIHCNQSGVVSDGALADMETVVCHKCGNRQGWRGWRRKVFGCRNCVCVEEILTYVTFVNGNRDDFQTVVRWWCTKMDWAATAVRILVYISRHTDM